MRIGNILLAFALSVSMQIHAEMQPITSLAKSDNPILVSAEQNRADQIVLTYRVPSPVFVTVPQQQLRGEQTNRAVISTCSYRAVPGEPEVPRIPVRIILPYGKAVASVEVLPQKSEQFTLADPLAFGEMEQPISVKRRITATHNETLYASDELYPKKLYDNIEQQKAFGVSIAKLDLYPLQYQPKSQKITFYQEVKLIVTLKEVATESDIRIDVERFKKRGAPSEENREALESYPSSRVRAEVDYILVTTGTIANSSAAKDLINLRQEQGLSTKVVTVSEIESGYSGNASSDKLRTFIKHAYNTWNTKFVTLGGDAGVVPHIVNRVKYGYNFENVDSDIPFQCLDGESWDGDYEAEVYVGRISAENVQEFSNQVHKIITYESEDSKSPVLRTSLANGQKLDWNNMGARAIRYLLSTVFPPTWEYDSLYDEQHDWVQAELVAALAKNKYGSLDHDGHGSVGGTMNFSVGETKAFTNTKYPFIYTLSCLTGDFSEDCIAEHFMNEHKVGGFFGGVQNSEVGLYMQSNSTQGSSPTIQRSFYEAFWEKGIEYFSQMNAYSHQMNSDRQFTCFTTNYFGDAATRFRARDHAVDSVVESSNLSLGNVSVITEVIANRHTLKFTVGETIPVAINLYSLNGKRVYSIPMKAYSVGVHSVDMRNHIATGLYIIELHSGVEAISKKIQL